MMGIDMAMQLLHSPNGFDQSDEHQGKQEKNLSSRYVVNIYRSKNHRITNWPANSNFSGSGLRLHLYVMRTMTAKNNTKRSENVEVIAVPFWVDIMRKTQTEKKSMARWNQHIFPVTSPFASSVIFMNGVQSRNIPAVESRNICSSFKFMMHSLLKN